MKKKYINFLQNILILLLSASALMLFAYQQLFPGSDGFLAGLFPSAQIITNTAGLGPEHLTSVQSLLRIAVSGTYGRYGSPHLTNTSDDFAGIRNLLQEALGSADTPETCYERDFRAALERSSVYCDWTVSLPLSVIAGMVGTTLPDTEIQVRRMVLSAVDGKVALHLTDDRTFLSCSTKVSTDALQTFIDSVQLNSVAFAYELGAESMDPYSLLDTEELPSYPLMAPASAAQPADHILATLGFNPNTNSRYTESSGTEVVRDSDRTVRIEPDGTLLYDSGGAYTPELSAAHTGDNFTASEAVLLGYRVLSQLIPDSEAGLCLRSVEANGSGWLVTFDYQINGVLCRLSSGEAAAQANISTNGITGFSMHMRRYTAVSGSGPLLLPLRQTLAIADRGSSGELSICYVDSGSTASAAWLVE